jgi:hypothetical protein
LTLKIEKYWQETLAPQSVPESIQNRFSIVGEAAKDQYSFRSDRVDGIANFLVVEEQVYELGDLYVVYLITRWPGEVIIKFSCRVSFDSFMSQAAIP